MSDNQETRRRRVWCLLRDQQAHVEPVKKRLGESVDWVYDPEWQPRQMLDASPDVVICVNEYHHDVGRCLEAAREAKIPSLLLQDGILEWRCQYENPLFGAGNGVPQHQPVLSDKIACLGQESARHIASWGNRDRVEVTGMPRLDFLLERQVAPRVAERRTVLVMTAKNPGFTPAQKEVTLQSLADLKRHLEARREVSVLWRVSREVARELGVENQYQETSALELVAVIERADAVITTLSTAMLEAMLCARPVAILDYHNVPRFIDAAWVITAERHISSVVSELFEPSVRKLAYQAECLAAALRFDGSAAARVAGLVEEMAERGALARNSGQALRLPANLVEGNDCAWHLPMPALSALYPGHPAFIESSDQLLRSRLARCEGELRRLREENQALRHRGAWISKLLGFWRPRARH